MELVARLIRSSEITLRNFLRWPPGSSLFSPGLEPSFAGMLPARLAETETELEDKKSEGYLWGVPKNRRTVEKRWSRKIGAENWHLKTLKPKTNLLQCDTCGHHYEAKHLCRNCYDRVVKETESIRAAAESQLGDNPEDKGIVVLYENERERIDAATAEANVLVELPRARPKWFSRNLLEKSTAGIDSKTTTVTTKTPNLA